MALRAISWRKLRFRFDWTLTFAMLAIVAVGLVNLWSAVQDRGPHLFSKQVSLLGLGFCVFLAIATFDLEKDPHKGRDGRCGRLRPR